MYIYIYVCLSPLSALSISLSHPLFSSDLASPSASPSNMHFVLTHSVLHLLSLRAFPLPPSLITRSSLCPSLHPLQHIPSSAFSHIPSPIHLLANGSRQQWLK